MARRLALATCACVAMLVLAAKADVSKKAQKGDTPPFFIVASGGWKSKRETAQLSKLIQEFSGNNLSMNWNASANVLVREVERLSEVLRVPLPASKNIRDAILISIGTAKKTNTTTMEFMRLDPRGSVTRLQKYELSGTAPTFFSGSAPIKVKKGLVRAMASIWPNLHAVELELRDGVNPPTVIGADSAVDDSRPQRISAVPFSDAFGLEPRDTPYMWKIRKSGFHGVDVPIIIEKKLGSVKCSKTVTLHRRAEGGKEKIVRLPGCK